MAQPVRFSVGIPTFNQAEYLPATLDSLLNQTRPPDEIVLSDHFSTDATTEIIREYAAKHSHIHGVQPPVGSNVGAQWDFTLRSLTGDWITLFSSDDLARPRFVEVLLQGAARREDAVLVRTAWENIDEQARVVSKEYLLSVKPVSTFPDNLLEQRNGPKASFAAFAVRRSTLEESGGYPMGMESFGDWPMFAQLAPFGSFLYEGEIIAGYRVFAGENKFRLRLGKWIRDEGRMFMDILPLAARRGGMQDVAWIAQSDRENYIRYLAAASREFDLKERAEIVPLFSDWALRVGGAAELERFAAGGNIEQPTSLKQHAKNFLRPYVQSLNAKLRQRS